ncbi:MULTISPECIES: flagellar export chaperone FliS [unclassified Shewanella]|uniref:flagellar export chaperone FliS n=1 Tax=unclassified Shewanella TaxID=196818 RepID=UPI001BC0BD86|nr:MULTISPECIES: flagellar export chaperone FliS [unclassified Shewanella]GIU09888.1 flagellar protein FliS [Shewanella sp. MBTL60-112-B1]GIU37400.1 flagellar protein FliS [Shewanella sp. MBTL60-112-B2]
MRGSLQSYRKVSLDSSINVASPHKIIQMMFAGALERLVQGRYAIEQSNLELKGVSLGKAISIVAGLNSSLNMEAEGDVAGNLSALYDFMLRRISDANINNDVQAIDDAMDVLRTIKEAWDAIPSELHELSSQN